MTEDTLITIALPRDLESIVGLNIEKLDWDDYHSVDGYTRELSIALRILYKIAVLVTENQPEAHREIDNLIDKVKALYKSANQKLDLIKDEQNAIIQKEADANKPDQFFVVEVFLNGIWKTMNTIFYSRNEAQSAIDFMAENYNLIMKGSIKRYRIVKRTSESPSINENVVLFP